MAPLLQRSLTAVILNALRVLITFGSGLMIARVLGAQDFGLYAFLIASFTNSRMLLDMGTSQAFFTFISKKSRPSSFFVYYALWLVAQFFMSVLFVWILAPDEWLNKIWQGAERSLVLCAFFAIFSQQTLWTTIGQIAESGGRTIIFHKASLLVSLAHFMIIFFLSSMDVLTISNILLIIAVEFFLSSLLLWQYVRPLPSNEYLSAGSVLKEFQIYCAPLVPFVWVSMLNLFGSRWLLQTYGGSEEQAFYAIAVQFSTLPFLLVGPVFNVLWREISSSNHKNQRDILYGMYSSASRILFLLPAIVAGLLLPWTSVLVSGLLGGEFKGAVIPLQIMLVYSLWQSVGALNLNMLYALEYTKVRTAIGISVAIANLALTFIAVAPYDLTSFGLELGAIGMASVMALSVCVNANFTMWWLARELRWKFDWRGQVVTAVVCVGLGYALYYLFQISELINEMKALNMALCVAIYTALILCFLFRWPSLLGQDPSDTKRLLQIFSSLRNRLVD